MLSAQSVAILLTTIAILCAVVSALCALACWRALKSGLSRVSTTSLRAEIDELRDSFGKHSALLKKINQRSVMQERRASSATDDGPSADESTADWKRRMRAQLIRPGLPVRHG
jgi:hypothetical protein